jgi:hypothetical protein
VGSRPKPAERRSKMEVKIVTKTREFTHAAMFEVEAGTTGLHGGDAGHGGRTYLRFKDQGSTDMRVDAREGEVTLILGGDAELENLIAGLQFALDVLKESKDYGTQEDTTKIGSRTVS